MKTQSAVEPLEARIAPATLIGLDNTNHLISFDSATPGTASPPTTVTGIGAGETLVGIDFRPATGVLYGLTIDAGNAGRIYAINPSTGVASFSALLTADPTDNTSPYATLAGANFGVDFNPSADRLRVVSDAQQNLRINVDTGRVFTDDAINPITPTVPLLSGAAYTNSFAGVASTTLYDIDIAGDRLVTQTPPNNGTLVDVGALGVNATDVGGFDILSTRTASGTVTDTGFAALTVGGVTGLYSINLATGAATNVGSIGGGTALRGLTSPTGTPSANAFTIDAANHLLGFNTATPTNTNDLGAITGIGAGETIIGFDFRPATGVLYAVTKDAANAGRVYTVDTTNAAAGTGVLLVADTTDETSPFTVLSGTNFGVDFNPVPDRLRIVSDSGQSLRINVTTGDVITDGNLTGTGTPGVFGAAYSNSFPGATATTLYDISSGTDQLFTQDPTTGALTLVGALGVDATAVGGFDIRGNGEAFATLEVAGISSLYRINLATGAATAMGQVGTGNDTLGLSIAPSGVLQFASPTATVTEGGTTTLTINRIGGSDGTVSVLVNTANGTATAGSDYTAISSRLITFGPGVTSQTIDISVTNDIVIEGNETFTATLTAGSGASVVNGSNVSTVTITDNDPVALIGLGITNNLLAFNSATSGTLTSNTAVTGLGAGETLIGIDFRPASGALYGITVDAANAGRIYLINPTTGAAIFSSRLVADPTDTTAPYTTLNGTNFGVDFNPVPDRLRLVSDTQQNLRINVDTGAVTTDTATTAGFALSGGAYTNAFAGATAASLYGIDITSDRLALQDPPNDGTLTAVGALGVDATGVGGFDVISSRTANGTVTNSGIAALTVGGVTGLYSVDLATGAVSSFGAIGDGTLQLRGLTSSTGTPAAKAFTVNATNHLLTFNTATPTVTADIGAITGIGAGETVIGFDFRPADGLLYVVTKNATNVGHIYSVNTTTAVATAVSTLAADGADATNPFTALAGTNFGVDFNPMGPADRLRIVSDSGQNLSINVTTGGVTTDADLNGTGTPGVFAASYSNAFSGATSTVLYDVSSGTDQLFTQDPTTGTLTLVGSLGVDATAIGGFDIRTNGEAFATLTVGGVTGLYSINLQSGAATSVGTVGDGSATSGLALATSGALQFATGAISIDESTGVASLTINRVGGSDGVVSVIVNTANGTAESGTDFTGGSRVVTFGSGVTSQIVQIPVVDDAAPENPETFTVTLGETTGGAVTSGLTTSTVTITDSPVISIADLARVETNAGTTVFSFIVSLDRASTTDVTVTYATAAGTATEGTDYTAATGTLTILAGTLTGTINVSVTGDTTLETNETFTVNLTNPSANVVLGDGTATGTILNDDPNSIKPNAIKYTDADGDIVKIKVDVGTLTGANVVFIPTGTQGGLQLASLNLTDPQFLNANLTITAKRGPSGGDGFADIGYLNATGNSLGTVAIAGDAGQIDANRVESLTVQSLGRLGLTTQAAGGSLESNFGSIGALIVNSDIVNASVVSAAGIGSATIRGNIIGGDADHSGSVEAGTRIKALVVGSLIGGDGLASGSIIADKVDALKVRGDINGGNILLSGKIAPATAEESIALPSLIVKGSVSNANILVGYDRTLNPVNADVRIGTVVVGGDWLASDLSAGINDGADNIFGTADDSVIAGGGSIVSRIASIAVTGRILGTLDSTTDGYGFTSEKIAAFQTGLTLFPLTSNADIFVIGATGDVNLRETRLV